MAPADICNLERNISAVRHSLLNTAETYGALIDAIGQLPTANESQDVSDTN